MFERRVAAARLEGVQSGPSDAGCRDNAASEIPRAMRTRLKLRATSPAIGSCPIGLSGARFVSTVRSRIDDADGR